MNAYIDEHEPAELHTQSCAIWETTSDPCDCRATSPRLTTAQRLDLLAPAGDPFQEAS